MIDRCVFSVTRIVNPRLLGLAFILAVGLAAFAGASLATAQRGGSGGPPAPDAYQGCVNNHTGALRVIGARQSCQAHETAIELGSSGGDAALLERIEALEVDNASQQSLIETQQGVIDALSELTATQQTTIGNQGGAITSLQAQVPDCLSTSGTEVYFTGCNVNIRSGSGRTDGSSDVPGGTVNGLGNLIVGYNESGSINGDERTGSHNLVVGPYQSYSSYGGLVVGFNNTISGPFSSVSGGAGNQATNEYSSVSGGGNNTASGDASSISGGNGNTAISSAASVSGGSENTASGNFSSVGGGFQEHADGYNEFLP